MRRLLATAAVAITAAGLTACSAPANQPCYWHNGIRHSHLSYNGRTLVLICRDGYIAVAHP